MFSLEINLVKGHVHANANIICDLIGCIYMVFVTYGMWNRDFLTFYKGFGVEIAYCCQKTHEPEGFVLKLQILFILGNVFGPNSKA